MQPLVNFIHPNDESAPLNNRVLKMADPHLGRVLIVEDENELVEVLEYNLLRSGFEVLIAHDGLEACRIIGRDKPDLILLDLLLPLLDGWEVCRMLRTHHDPLVARTPVIMLSALGTADDRLKGYDLGADLYLPKPYVVKEVVLKSRQLIEQRREYLALADKITSLENWNSLQDNWQHVLFHELRNQLTIISGMAQNLNQKDGLQKEHSQEYARHIHQSSDYLSALAMNYLLVRQVEKNPETLQLELLRMQDLFTELETLFVPLATLKSSCLSFDCEEFSTVELHPIGLKIILSSLIDNALKYANCGGIVNVSAQRVEQEMQIVVADNGPGIAPEEQEKVFEKFYRGGGKVPGSEGSGLGLYMARTLAESMGGWLTLGKTAQPGCRFLLSFS